MPEVTLITGASSGLGKALAPRLAAAGDPVALCARRAEPLEALAAEIRAAGGRAMTCPLNVTDAGAIQATVARVEAELGPVDRLIANAGIGATTEIDTFSAETVGRVMETNVMGVARCVEAVLPGMLARGRGHLVAVASLAGYRGLPGNGAYCASKAAVIALMESLRIECAPRGVAVTTLSPGFVKTPLTDRNTFKMPWLLEVDDAADRMHRAIQRRASEYAFPWQLASVVKVARVLPNALYDRALKGQKAEKLPEPE